MALEAPLRDVLPSVAGLPKLIELALKEYSAS